MKKSPHNKDALFIMLKSSDSKSNGVISYLAGYCVTVDITCHKL